MADDIESEIELGWDAFASAVRAQKDNEDRAIRERIAALTEEDVVNAATVIGDIEMAGTYGDDVHPDVARKVRAALVSLLAPEVPNGK